MNVRKLLAMACSTLLASAAAQAANLNHHYDFASGVIDLAGNQNGTLFGNANVAGGTLNLDGNGDWAEFSSLIVPTAGSYSVALFARGNGVQASHTELISQGFSGGPGFYIGTDFTGSAMRVTDSWQVTGVPFGAPNVWTHYALVVNAAASTSTLYVGGVAVAGVPFAIVTSGAGSNTRLGRQFSPFAEFFNGSIDDVRTYDGALTAQEVAMLATPVPEPASVLLMAVGGVLIGAAARRRRAASSSGPASARE